MRRRKTLRYCTLLACSKVSRCNPSRLALLRRGRPKRDEVKSSRNRALVYFLSMIFSENRFTLFRIML
jgi:hypothetical protein